MITYSYDRFSDTQITRAMRILYREGWEYREDQRYPVSDARRMGWWVRLEDPDYSRPRGDAKPWADATETTYKLYSGHTIEELS